MALTENGNGMVMPVAPMGYGYGGGFGNGFGGFGGFGGWGSDIWLILIVLFAMGGFGGFGMGGYGMGGYGMLGGAMYPWMNQAELTQAGFNQAATAGQLTGIQTAVNSGFASAEVANCNRAMDAMQTAYNNQIASMNQNFANQQALDTRLDTIASNQQECCCENRAAVADLKYTVATEACADRAAINDALRDVIAANTASTQRILDTMCQDKIDAKNEKIAELQNQLNMANLQASQNAQTAAILANNEAQTTALEQYLAPVPRPAYVVQNPNCCGNNFGFGGCGCAA